jgi:hypothetical protein
MILEPPAFVLKLFHEVVAVFVGRGRRERFGELGPDTVRGFLAQTETDERRDVPLDGLKNPRFELVHKLVREGEAKPKSSSQ